MNSDEWSSLTSSPGWQPFLNYLADYREAIKERWARGEKLDAALAQLRCEIIGDIINMDFETIDHFYRPDKELRDAIP